MCCFLMGVVGIKGKGSDRKFASEHRNGKTAWGGNEEAEEEDERGEGTEEELRRTRSPTRPRDEHREAVPRLRI